MNNHKPFVIVSPYVDGQLALGIFNEERGRYEFGDGDTNTPDEVVQRFGEALRFVSWPELEIIISGALL